MSGVPWPCLSSVRQSLCSRATDAYSLSNHLYSPAFSPNWLGYTWSLTVPFLKTVLPLENSGIWVGVNWRWREAVCSKGSVGCANTSARALLLVVHRVTRPLGAAQSLGWQLPSLLRTGRIWELGSLRLCVKWAKELSKNETLRFGLFCHKIDPNLHLCMGDLNCNCLALLTGKRKTFCQRICD